MRKYGHILLMGAIWIMVGCSRNASGPSTVNNFQRGDAIECRETRSMDRSTVQFLLDESDITWPYSVQSGIQAYELIYQTRSASGQLIRASASLILPDSGTVFPLMGIQHGTVVKRTQVASGDPLRTMEGMLGILVSSMGYAVCVPDYPGLGVSEGIHPYVHASLGVAVADGLRAAESTVISQGFHISQRFLAGYSEGGYATLAAQQVMEADYETDMPLTAVVPMAGPYDLVQTMEMILQDATYSHPAYVAFLLTAYDDVYGWDRLTSFFQAPYASQMRSLFNGNMSYGQISAVLPATLGGLLQTDFVERCRTGSETELLNALYENTLLHWQPRTPILLIHGEEDDVVPFVNAVAARDSLTKAGATVSLISIPGGTHESAALPAILEALNWLQTWISG